MTIPVHYINRESDGTTYWHTAYGWMAAPTQIDGTPDLHCASYVVDFEPGEGEIGVRGQFDEASSSTELFAWLRTKVCEGGDGCGAPPSVRPYSIKFEDDPDNTYFEWQEDKSRTVHYCDDCAHLLRRGWLPEVKLIEGGAA
jgi:hypothetical protein